MERDKLTIKELAPYLPYGLKGEYNINDVMPHLDKDEIRCKVLKTDSVDFFLNFCKPLLFPLSSLTKEIEVNGERFVPIDQLDLFHNFSVMHFSDIEKDPTRYPYTIVEKLLEWHFDVFGLIERGLAIDKTNI